MHSTQTYILLYKQIYTQTNMLENKTKLWYAINIIDKIRRCFIDALKTLHIFIISSYQDNNIIRLNKAIPYWYNDGMSKSVNIEDLLCKDL